MDGMTPILKQLPDDLDQQAKTVAAKRGIIWVEITAGVWSSFSRPVPGREVAETSLEIAEDALQKGGMRVP
ncbi:MAG: hypothetical protein B7Z37_06355 [Verrucomicrobia bacterium 12-59-8]|nr:MAG: hypothetical protein B7Z37_06355 [Verrucomicrobia bacterium 12-59-8]